MEMSILLKNSLIFDPKSPYHNSVQNVFLEDGFIRSIGNHSSNAKEEYDLGGKLLTSGLVDMNANFCEPGDEHKEDIESGSKCAIYGGFTDVCLMPNTDPVIETKSDVEFIRSKNHGVELYPIAAIGESAEDGNLTELLELREAGAVAFSNGSRSISNSELLIKALQYVAKFDGLILSKPSSSFLSSNFQMHEGVVSTGLGLKGEPGISEKIHINQQLDILRYVGGRLHFSMISSSEGVRLIKAAKKEGLNVTCDVGVNYLMFNDEDLEDFDTNFKVSPPFRSEKDRRALIKGLKDGTIDVIVSGHEPQDQESKLLEFDLAEFGAIGLQTVFGVLNLLDGEIEMGLLLEKLTHGPREILGMEQVVVNEGMPAKLSVFDPDRRWVMDGSTNFSKSRNSPFWGKELKGVCLGVINGQKSYLNIQ